MKVRFITFPLGLLFVACTNGNHKEIYQANINRNDGNYFLQHFSNYILKNINRDSSIMVSIIKAHDSISIELTNRRPKSSFSLLHGYMRFNDCDIFFYGDYFPNPIYSLSNQIVDSVDIKFNSDTVSELDRTLLFRDDLRSNALYVKERLIYYDPPY